jgi:phosphomannomutase
MQGVSALSLVLLLQLFGVYESMTETRKMSQGHSLANFQRASNGFDMRGVVAPCKDIDGPILTNVDAFWVGVGFGESLKQSNSLVSKLDTAVPITVGIGRDSRESGIELTRWLAGGLEAVGVRAYDVGLCTTPAMYLSCIIGLDSDDQMKENPWPFSGAISVTASHLPSHWNGFKFFTPDKPSNIGEEGIQEIIDICNKKEIKDFVPVASDFKGRSSQSFLPRYSEFLKRTVREKFLQTYDGDLLNSASDDDMSSSPMYPLRGLKICVNAGNGAGGFLAETLSDLGADASSSLHLDPDGNFPNHIANPEDRIAIECTASAVVRAAADLGICLDTDADRVGLVEGSSVANNDPDGGRRLLNRNCLIALVSKVALRSVASGVIVTDSATSNGLSKFIESLGGTHVRYKKGYRFVIEKGRSIEGCVAAVECSGHGAWKDNGWVDDGCYTAVRLVTELSLMRLKQRHTLSTAATTAGAAAATDADAAAAGAIDRKELSRLSDLLIGFTEPEESTELRFRVSGGPNSMKEITEKAVATLKDIANSPLCNTAQELNQSCFSWNIEKINHEGLRVNFDFTIRKDKEELVYGRKLTGWCMLRASLHEPILSMQIESDQLGGMKEVARILLSGSAREDGDASLKGFALLADLMDIAPLQLLALSVSEQ